MSAVPGLGLHRWDRGRGDRVLDLSFPGEIVDQQAGEDHCQRSTMQGGPVEEHDAKNILTHARQRDPGTEGR